MRIASRLATGLIALMSIQSASAQTWIMRTGIIRTIVVSHAANSAFRVTISNGGVDQLSDCMYTFAYMNTSDDNYQAKASALMTASVAKKTVTLSFAKEASNWCRLTDVAVDFSS